MSRSKQFIVTMPLVTVLLLCAGTGRADPSGSPAKDIPPASEQPGILNLTVRDALPDGFPFAPTDFDRRPAGPG
ncbi:hypothetical protein FJ250_11085, partial [bacterium]|nr:hypothetical protein [bacterium]